MILTPYPHQKQGILHIERHGGNVLLADEQGLGKTLQALGCLRRNPSWMPAVVVCPASVKYNWESEVLHVVGIRADICEGETPPNPKSANFKLHAPIRIINYDILGSWTDYLKRAGIRTLILDESHYLASRSAKRTKAAKEIAKGVSHRIALTGTPMNKPEELYSTLNIVWPHEFPRFWDYASRYCDPKWTLWGWNTTGKSNLDELNARLTALGMIRRRKDVLQLPPKRTRVVNLPLSNSDEYALALRDFMTWVRQTIPHKERKIKKVEQLAKVGYLMRLAAKMKMRATCEWANRYLQRNPGKKLALMAVHKKAIQVFQNRIDAKSVTVDGAITGRKRQAAIDQAQHDPATRLFIGNIKAAGTGINLTSFSCLAFTEFWYNPNTHSQASDRIHRIGQRHPVDIVYLVGEGSLEVKVCKMLQSRQATISEAIDGSANGSGKEVNIYEELLKEIERGLL